MLFVGLFHELWLGLPIFIFIGNFSVLNGNVWLAME